MTHERNLCRFACLPESRGPGPSVSGGFTTGKRARRLIACSNFQPAEHGG